MCSYNNLFCEESDYERKNSIIKALLWYECSQ